MSNTTPTRGRSPFTTATLVAAGLVVLALVWMLQRHHGATSAKPATSPSETVSINVSGDPSASPTSSASGHISTPPAPYPAASLQAAEDTARQFLLAYHSSSYTDVRPEAQPNAAKPYITPAMYARMIARLPKPGQQDSGDDQYVQQVKAEQRVVHAHVSSIGIASGDGDSLPKNEIPLVAYFHTSTYTISNSSGDIGADQPSHLTMVLQGGRWLVSTADGI